MRNFLKFVPGCNQTASLLLDRYESFQNIAKLFHFPTALLRLTVLLALP
ncbi:hypothetical protein N8E86_03630 [Avibacterium paragallinarum]|nr:hypothetical protein [Avibacterium paragallinarum]UXN35315.1 hypothetical protein N8E86_03630 [Avibacterium paragallinarum]